LVLSSWFQVYFELAPIYRGFKLNLMGITYDWQKKYITGLQ